MHRRTGGNPFFAQQVSWSLKDGRTGVPPGAREALEQRFAALPEACAAVLRAAAVAGPRISAGLVARVTGGSPDTVAGLLAEAVQARGLARTCQTATGSCTTCSASSAYQEPPAADRARLHQRMGVELEAERARGGDVSLAELARHFVQADPGSAWARRYCVAAAREAASRLAYEEAVHHWEGALAAAAGQGAGLRVETLSSWRRRGGEQATRRRLPRRTCVRPSWRGASRPRRGWPVPRSACTRSGAACGGRPARLSPLSEALDTLGNGDELLRLRVMASLARVLAWHRLDVARAQELAEQAVAAARASGDGPALPPACSPSTTRCSRRAPRWHGTCSPPNWPNWPRAPATARRCSRPGTRSRPVTRPEAPASSGVFTRDGALWTLAYGGLTVRMRDAKGLADLAVLSPRPAARSRPPT